MEWSASASAAATLDQGPPIEPWAVLPSPRIAPSSRSPTFLCLASRTTQTRTKKRRHPSPLLPPRLKTVASSSSSSTRPSDSGCLLCRPFLSCLPAAAPSTCSNSCKPCRFWPPRRFSTLTRICEARRRRLLAVLPRVFLSAYTSFAGLPAAFSAAFHCLAPTSHTCCFASPTRVSLPQTGWIRLLLSRSFDYLIRSTSPPHAVAALHWCGSSVDLARLCRSLIAVHHHHQQVNTEILVYCYDNHHHNTMRTGPLCIHSTIADVRNMS